MEKSFLLSFLVISFLSCKSGQERISPPKPIPTVNQFSAFYQIFHTDSAYQMSHIQFPLEGVPEQGDTTAYPNGFKWLASDWAMHKLFNEKDTSFMREFKLLDSTMVIEDIYHKNSPMRMERRFSYNGAWNLIYYSPMRLPIEIKIN